MEHGQINSFPFSPPEAGGIWCLYYVHIVGCKYSICHAVQFNSPNIIKYNFASKAKHKTSTKKELFLLLWVGISSKGPKKWSYLLLWISAIYLKWTLPQCVCMQLMQVRQVGIQTPFSFCWPSRESIKGNPTQFWHLLQVVPRVDQTTGSVHPQPTLPNC